MAEFSIVIPADAELRKSIETALKSDQSLAYTERVYGNMFESMEDVTNILGYIFNFSTAAALAMGLKYASPVLVEYLKRKYIYVRIGEAEIKVASAADLPAAVKAANDLAKAQRGKKS